MMSWADGSGDGGCVGVSRWKERRGGEGRAELRAFIDGLNIMQTFDDSLWQTDNILSTYHFLRVWGITRRGHVVKLMCVSEKYTYPLKAK